MKSKFIASAVTALLIAGGAAVALAAPASAHTGGVTGVASCEADGTYTVTWTYAATNVPADKEAETKAMTTSAGVLKPVDGVDKGGQVFLSVWSEHQVNVPGAPVKVGNWSAQFKTVGIPGDSTQVTTMVQTDWKDGPSEDPVGKVTLDGKCGAETPKKVVVCKYVSTPGSGERPSHLIEVSVNALKDFPGTFPWAFADAQGSSVALGYAPGSYTLADCPYEKPEKPESITEHDETVVYGGWSTPEIDCSSEVGDEVTITREVTTTPRTRTTGDPTYDAQTNSWTQGAFGEWVDGESTTRTQDGIYVVTAEDVQLPECIPPAPPIPDATVTVTYTDWVGGEPTCSELEVTQTRMKTTSAVLYGWTNDGISREWVLVPDEPVVETTVETRVVTYEGEACPTPTPTPTPTETAQPTPSPTATAVAAPAKLAVTGGDAWVAWTAGAFGFVLISLGVVLTIAKRRKA